MVDVMTTPTGEREKPKRVECPNCGYYVRMRKDGSPQRHLLYGSRDQRFYCDEAPWLRRPAEEPTP